MDPPWKEAEMVRGIKGSQWEEGGREAGDGADGGWDGEGCAPNVDRDGERSGGGWGCG